MEYSNEDKKQIYWINERIKIYKNEIILLTSILTNKEGNPFWNSLKELLVNIKDESLMETTERLFEKGVSYEQQNITARKAGAVALGCNMTIKIVEKAQDKINELNANIENATLAINVIHQKYKKIEEKKQHRYGGKNV